MSLLRSSMTTFILLFDSKAYVICTTPVRSVSFHKWVDLRQFIMGASLLLVILEDAHLTCQCAHSIWIDVKIIFYEFVERFDACAKFWISLLLFIKLSQVFVNLTNMLKKLHVMVWRWQDFGKFRRYQNYHLFEQSCIKSFLLLSSKTRVQELIVC